MANTLANRVKMTVASAPGTGTITLGSAISGFQSFATAGVSNAATVPYVMEDGGNWEIGIGTYTSAGTTLARTSITASSNSGSAISASSAAIVMISPLAADLQAGTSAGNLVQLDGSAKIPAVDGSQLTNLNAANIASGTLGVSRGGTGLTSLTAGYIPYGNGTGAFSSSGNLYFDGTNLGITNTSPVYKLDIIGNGMFAKGSNTTSIAECGVGASDYSTSYRSTFLRQFSSATTGTIFGAATAGLGMVQFLNTLGAFVGTNGPTFLGFGTYDTERMRIGSTGNVAVNDTNTTLATMFVKGRASTTGFYTLGASGAKLYIDYAGGGNNYSDALTHYWRNTASTDLMTLDNNGNLGIGNSPDTTTLGRNITINGVAAGTNTGLVFQNAATQNGLIYTNSSFMYVGTTPSIPLLLGTANAERMRIASDGSVGIGTTSPGYKLTVAGTSGSAVVSLLETGVRSWGIRAGGAGTNTFDIADFTAGASRLTIDSAGNLGLGVTPSAWSAYKAIQVASTGGALSSSSSSDFELTTNAYNAGAGWLSQGAGVASSRYRLYAGTHACYNAPSSTSGAAITFTQAMTLDASGNLGIGTTNPRPSLEISKPSVTMALTNTSATTDNKTWDIITGANQLTFRIVNDAYSAAGNCYTINRSGTSTSSHIWYSGASAEAMRIDSSGRVGIGSTPNASTTGLTLGGTATGGAVIFQQYLNYNVASDVTTVARGVVTNIGTNAAAFTLANLQHYYAGQGTLGAGSAVTSQFGYVAESNLTGATNNYGFYSAIASGTGRWNFYAAGTANNYFAGNVLIGTTTAGASKLTVADDSIQINTAKTPASATATGTTGQVCWDASYIYVCTATNTWKRAAIATW